MENKQFKVDAAEDWRTAFEKVHEFDPHIILLDVVMPEVPGDRLVETIRGWKSEVEIIMIAASVSEKMKEDCLANGAFAVLGKPIAFQELIHTINLALEQRALLGSSSESKT